MGIGQSISIQIKTSVETSSQPFSKEERQENTVNEIEEYSCHGAYTFQYFIIIFFDFQQPACYTNMAAGNGKNAPCDIALSNCVSAYILCDCIICSEKNHNRKMVY